MIRSRHLLISLLALSATPALAHTVWLEAVPGQPTRYDVRFGGHAGKIEPFSPAKLKSVEATDASGGKVRVARDDSAEGVALTTSARPSVLLVHMDNGIHTKPASGPTVEKPMNEVPGAKSATWAVKYHKTIVEWNAQAARTFGQPFEVVPHSTSAPRAGQPLTIRVFRDGKPVAGVRAGLGEEPDESSPQTDADGRLTITPAAGVNRWWIGKRFPARDARYTEISYEYSLVFTAS